MSTFQYEEGMASAEQPLSGTPGIQGTGREMPMSEHHMEGDFTQYPWETTAPDIPSEEAVVIAPDRMSIVTVTHRRRVQEIAREHIERVSERIPEEEAREGFVRGAGMFDFPAPPGELDDQLS
jgi:hypothetical protein